MMKRSVLTSLPAIALMVAAFPSLAPAQTAPSMGGGYKDVIPIPIHDPNIKAIAGALFKPAGAGPFPGVVYMSGCGGVSSPPEMALEKTVIDHLIAKGVAVLVVDPFTPRNEPEGICADLNGQTFVRYAIRGGDDVVAALKVLQATPGVDRDRVFLQGYSWGAISSLFAMDPNTPSTHDARIAGLIAYYPYCYDNVQFSTPTLVLIGDKDDWTPAKLCEAAKGRPNLDVVVFPGATHAFNVPFEKPVDYLGHHFEYDQQATEEAQKDADAFLDAHLK